MIKARAIINNNLNGLAKRDDGVHQGHLVDVVRDLFGSENIFKLK